MRLRRSPAAKKPYANKGRPHEIDTREAAWTAWKRGCARNPDIDPEDPKELHNEEGMAVLRQVGAGLFLDKKNMMAQLSRVPAMRERSLPRRPVYQGRRPPALILHYPGHCPPRRSRPRDHFEGPPGLRQPPPTAAVLIDRYHRPRRIMILRENGE